MTKTNKNATSDLKNRSRLFENTMITLTKKLDEFFFTKDDFIIIKGTLKTMYDAGQRYFITKGSGFENFYSQYQILFEKLSEIMNENFIDLIYNYLQEQIGAVKILVRQVLSKNSRDSEERTLAIEKMNELFQATDENLQKFSDLSSKKKSLLINNDLLNQHRKDFDDLKNAFGKEISTVFRAADLTNEQENNVLKQINAFLDNCRFSLSLPKQFSERRSYYNFWNKGHHTTRFHKLLENAENDFIKCFPEFIPLLQDSEEPVEVPEKSSPSRNKTSFDVSQYLDEIRRLKARIRELEAELSRIKSDQDYFQKENDLLNEKIKYYEDSIESLKKRYNPGKSKENNLNAIIFALNARLQGSDPDMALLSKKNYELELIRNQLETEINELQKLLLNERLRGQELVLIDNADQRLITDNKKLHEENEKLNKKIIQLKLICEEIKTIKLASKEAENQLTKLQTSYNSLFEKSKKDKEEIDNLKQKIRVLTISQSTIEDYQDEIEKLKNLNEKLKTDNTSLQNQVTTLSTENNSFILKIKILNNQITSLQTENLQYKTQITQLQQELADLKAKIESTPTPDPVELDDLKEKVKNRDLQIGKLEQDIEGLKQKVEDMNQNLEDKDDDIYDKEQKIQKLQTEIDDSQIKINQIKEKKKKRKLILIEKEKEIKIQIEQLKNKDEEIKKLSEELNKIKEKVKITDLEQYVVILKKNEELIQKNEELNQKNEELIQKNEELIQKNIESETKISGLLIKIKQYEIDITKITEENIKLNQTIENLNQQILQLNIQIQDLKQQTIEFNSQVTLIQKLNQKIEELTKINLELTNELEILKKNVNDETKIQIKQLKKDKKKLEDEKDGLITNNDELINKNQELSDKNKKLSKTNKTLTNEKDELNQQIDELNQEKIRLNKLIEKLTKNNEELTQQNDQLNNDNVELNKKIKLLEIEIEKLTKRIQELTIKSRDIDLDDLNRRIDELTNKNNDLQTENDDLEQTNDNLQTENNDLKSKIQKLQKQNNKLSTENEDLINENNQLKNDNETIDQKDNEIEELKKRIKEITDERDELNRNIEDLNKIITELREQIEELKQKLKDKEDHEDDEEDKLIEIEKQKKKIQKLTDENEKIQKKNEEDMNDYLTQIGQLNEEIEKLKEKIEKLKEKNDNLKNQVDELTNENQDLTDENEKLNQAIEKLENKYKKLKNKNQELIDDSVKSLAERDAKILELKQYNDDVYASNCEFIELSNFYKNGEKFIQRKNETAGEADMLLNEMDQVMKDYGKLKIACSVDERNKYVEIDGERRKRNEVEQEMKQLKKDFKHINNKLGIKLSDNLKIERTILVEQRTVYENLYKMFRKYFIITSNRYRKLINSKIKDLDLAEIGLRKDDQNNNLDSNIEDDKLINKSSFDFYLKETEKVLNIKPQNKNDYEKRALDIIEAFNNAKLEPVSKEFNEIAKKTRNIGDDIENDIENGDTRSKSQQRKSSSKK